jgi:S1-C subfamily serine protease
MKPFLTNQSPNLPKFLPRKTLLCLTIISVMMNPIWGHAKPSSRRSPIVIAVEKVSPAVVNISTTVHERVRPFFPFSRDDFFKDFFPDFFTREYTRTSLGSGVIIDGSKGYIITNHHVVARATEIKVITSDQKEYQGRILGSAPRSDLAVLQIETKEELPEIGMGNSDGLMIGETVIAIGNPFGLSHTVTTGVVSALDRSVRTEQQVYRHFIQTDASINPGNSGGPLLNVEGELIGINTAIYQKAQGIGFAIPINKAKRIVRELIREGRVHGSPAAEAGLKRGDLLLSLERIPISSPQDYRDALGEYTVGYTLKLRIQRKGKELNISVKPARFPLRYASELFYRRVGIEVEEMNKTARRQYDLKEGVSVKHVGPDSSAGEYGIRAGDLLIKINNVPIKDMHTFNKTISQYRHLSSITLIVQRGPYGYSLTLPF